jgi:hypothetical protein
MRQIRAIFAVVSALLLLVLALAYDQIGLRQAPMLVALLVLVEVLIFILSGVPYWRRVLVLAKVALAPPPGG